MTDFALKIPKNKIVREHLHEQIASVLEEMIASQSLPPGSRLPSERELAANFNVNRATLRLAIRLIEQRGLIEMKVGSGIYIKDVPGSTVADAIERYVNFKSCPQQDLQAFREILEPEIAVMAAQNATAQELEALLDYSIQIEEMANNPDIESYAGIDAGFHENLALATHNMMIIAVISGVQKVTRSWIYASHGRISAQHSMNLIQQGASVHRKIYDAVAAHNTVHAREAMRTHMRISRSTLEVLRELSPEMVGNDVQGMNDGGILASK